jgi:hypothetical protein
MSAPARFPLTRIVYVPARSPGSEVSARPRGGTVSSTGVGVWIVTDCLALELERKATAMATNAGAETVRGLSAPELPITKFAGIRALVAPPAGLLCAAPPELEGSPAPPEEPAPPGTAGVPECDPDVVCVALVVLEDEELVVLDGVVVCDCALAVVDCELVEFELPPHPAISTGRRASGMSGRRRRTGFRA